MSDYTSDHEFKIMNQQYLGLIGFGLIALVFQMLFLSFAPDQITLATMLHLGADCAACFWISWIVLDGLDWRTYVYIFVFCVVLPVLMDLAALTINILRKPNVSWRKSEGALVKTYYFLLQMYHNMFRR